MYARRDLVALYCCILRHTTVTVTFSFSCCAVNYAVIRKYNPFIRDKRVPTKNRRLAFVYLIPTYLNMSISARVNKLSYKASYV